MTDISQTLEADSDQLNADDLMAEPRTIKITSVVVRGKSGNKQTDKQPADIYFEGDNKKPFKPCLTMRRVLFLIWGKSKNDAFVGRSMTLYRDPTVRFGHDLVGGVRISHATNLDKDTTVTITKNKKKVPYTVKVLKVAENQTSANQPSSKDAMKAAKATASNGTEAFKEWWNSDEGKGARGAVKANMTELQAICKEADTAMEADPFGLPPIEGKPSDEELAKAEAAALGNGDVVE